ncbi:MAG: sigma-54 interaction domain-containing protein, partial [Thermoanaerobaculia bacterium]
QGPWHALATFFEKGDPEALARLYEQIGPLSDAQARALAALAERAPREVERKPVPLGDMVGESPAFLSVLERIGRLAPGDLPILILGESGTGKELAARRIHRLSGRSRAPFIAVNCAALSETLILSDLFGHARGAFTGADRSRQGVFESANGGTVFLDEIGDLPLSAQGLLLRVLQEGEVRPLGETLPRKVNVRVLAATHRDLGAMVSEKTFRQDLYYRLKVGSVSLPALRDRGEDVLLLAERFASRELSAAARALLLGHLWPGNIRELQNVLSLACALAGEGAIEPEHIELPETQTAPAGSYHQQVEALRRRLITAALARHGNNHAEAARELGLSRQSISYLIRQLRLG